MRLLIILLMIFVTESNLFSQQIPDLNYSPEIPNPIYQINKGSVIYIDEGHHNFHTKNGRYLPFSLLLEKDGYVVEEYKGKFNRKQLDTGKILVIVNALNEVNKDNWDLPNPSAFTKNEIDILQKWVFDGGSIFLIADHMPFPGAAEELAAVFGFKFFNGFNIDVINPAYFWKSDGSIVESAITLGRDSTEHITKIPKTEGQAFQIPDDAKSILKFYSTSMILFPDKSWDFHSETPLKRIEGWSQGAFKKYGEGRIVVFGEASMFSAQIGEPGKRKMGMNSDNAKDNYKLLLNIIHWLDGIIE